MQFNKIGLNAILASLLLVLSMGFVVAQVTADPAQDNNYVGNPTGPVNPILDGPIAAPTGPLSPSIDPPSPINPNPTGPVNPIQDTNYIANPTGPVNPYLDPTNPFTPTGPVNPTLDPVDPANPTPPNGGGGGGGGGSDDEVTPTEEEGNGPNTNIPTTNLANPAGEENSAPTEEISNQNEGFLARITGAVIGAVGEKGMLGAGIFLVVLGLAGLVVYNKQGAAAKAQ